MCAPCATTSSSSPIAPAALRSQTMPGTRSWPALPVERRVYAGVGHRRFGGDLIHANYPGDASLDKRYAHREHGSVDLSRDPVYSVGIRPPRTMAIINPVSSKQKAVSRNAYRLLPTAYPKNRGIALLVTLIFMSVMLAFG